jgi:hypothetical protein
VSNLLYKKIQKLEVMVYFKAPFWYLATDIEWTISRHNFHICLVGLKNIHINPDSKLDKIETGILPNTGQLYYRYINFSGSQLSCTCTYCCKFGTPEDLPHSKPCCDWK